MYVLNQNNDQIKIIAECKKSSPSAGLIVDSYDPIAICSKYKTKGYKNLSILTEEKYFQGSNEDLTKVKKELNMPILQKDFIYDEWQIFEAKSCGADCILLISEYLNFEQLQSLVKTAESLEIDVLVEFHRLEELEKIINLKVREKNLGYKLPIVRIINSKLYGGMECHLDFSLLEGRINSIYNEIMESRQN